MSQRSVFNIINDLVNSITSKRPDMQNAAVRTGSVVRDVVIEAPAREFETVYAEQEHIKKRSSVEFAEELTPAELDSLAENYDIVRDEGTPSTGLVSLVVRDFGSPVEGYKDIVIPAGTQVSAPATLNRRRIDFTTQEEVTMYASSYGVYLNITTGNFEIQAPVESISSGMDTNVGAGEINEVVSAPTEITDVINLTSTAGGSEPETNIELADRIRRKLRGNNLGTKDGYAGLVDRVPGVLHSIIITPNDVEMVRTQFGGAVDILIVGTILRTHVDSFVVSDSSSFLPTLQPLHDVTSVYATPLGEDSRLLLPGEYEIVEDDGIYARTHRSNTLVNVFIDLEHDTDVEITYAYNSLITELQGILDDDSNRIIASDILIREAVQRTLDISFNIQTFSGHDLSEVILDIRSYIVSQINGTGLGGKIDKSDVVAWAYAGSEGVDTVSLPSMTFILDGEPVADSAEITKVEYIRPGAITINGQVQ